MIEGGHFLRFYYKTEQRFLADIEHSDKKLYTSIKDYFHENMKISALRVQNYQNILTFFLAFNFAFLFLFACSLTLKKIKRVYKIRRRRKKTSKRTESSQQHRFTLKNLRKIIKFEVSDSRCFCLFDLKGTWKPGSVFNNTKFEKPIEPGSNQNHLG